MELAKKEKDEIIVVDISSKDLPDLNNAQEFPIDLCGNYWTPEAPGESKRMFFVEIKPQKVLSMEDQQLIELDCAVFLEQKDGVAQTIINGSRRLVGVIEQYVDADTIKRGTPLLITYLGKRKNKSNGFYSDNWSIKPLLLKI